MKLTEAKVRNVKPRDKQFKIFDGDGLFLLITPNGKKGWRFKYRILGKEKLLSFGTYPEVSLFEARDKRHEARKLVASGIDPVEIRKAQKEINTQCNDSFEIVAREWHLKYSTVWSDTHAHTTIKRLERDVFPWMGKMSVDIIKAPDLLSVLRRIENRGAIETAHRVKSICGQVFRYAIATGRADRDIAADLKGALPPSIPTHLASITDPVKVGQLLNAIDGYDGSFVVKCALRLAPLVFVRPGEIRTAEWSEIDFDNSLWSIPAEKMKMKMSHIVPLSKQSIEILKELYPLTSRSAYLFPSHRSNARPLSNNALNAALRSMGFSKEQMTTHGFRAMARTLLDEVLKFRPDYIEHQLAHAVRDPLGRAYNRTTHLDERVKMMQVWADYLDGLRGEHKMLR